MVMIKLQLLYIIDLLYCKNCGARRVSDMPRSKVIVRLSILAVYLFHVSDEVEYFVGVTNFIVVP